MENALTIANFFLKQALVEGKIISPLKLQLLMFEAHGWYLSVYNEPLVPDRIEAWKYGPVIVSVYKALKNELSTAPLNIAGMSLKDGIMGIDYRTAKPKTIWFLGLIWKGYKDFAAFEMANLVNKINSPWYITWYYQQGMFNKGTVIEDELTGCYYNELLRLQMAETNACHKVGNLQGFVTVKAT